MEILPGIHMVEGLRGANGYIAASEDSILIIDTGMPGSAAKFVEYIKKLGRNPSEVKNIVMTHADLDHSGSAAELKEITGARIAIHEGDAPNLSGEKELKKVSGIMGFLISFMGRFSKFSPIKPDIVLKDGDQIDGFNIIHTPGHSVGSICLYQPGQVVFAGDAILSDNKGNPTPPWKAASLDIVQARESVKKIAQLEFEVLLTGHGKPVVGDASTKLRTMIAKWP